MFNSQHTAEMWQFGLSSLLEFYQILLVYPGKKWVESEFTGTSHKYVKGLVQCHILDVRVHGSNLIDLAFHEDSETPCKMNVSVLN